jgi:hypothetical protein
MAFIQFLEEPGGRRLVIHSDNARPHTARKYRTCCPENEPRLAPHPPDSPDFTLLDFFLFGHVNNRLQGIVFQSPEELLEGIREVLDEIPVGTLTRVFEHWMERPEWVSQNNGDSHP